MSASPHMGQKSYATTRQGKRSATWGQVLQAVPDEMVNNFCSRLQKLQRHGLLTDTTTMFDVSEYEMNGSSKSRRYIQWSLHLDDAVFAFLGLVGHASTVGKQTMLIDDIVSGEILFDSEEQVVDLLWSIRSPLGELSNQLKHYTADIISGTGVARARSLWASQ